MTVERLDFSKPPPGYEVRDTSYEDGDSEVGGYGVIVEEWSWLADGYTDHAASQDICIADAWLHFKEDNDPPGMRVMGCVEAGAYTIDLDDGTHLAGHWYTSPEQALAAAWAWYEDALEVADLLDDEDIRRVMERVDDGCPLRGDPWCPRVLAWSADQRAEVRRWLACNTTTGQKVSHPPALPEVLRG